MRTSTTQIPVGLPLNRSHSLSKGLAGLWPLNEGGGQVAFDRMLNNNGALTSGAVYAKHLKGNCVSFDGTDDIVGAIGKVTSYNFIQNTLVFSISCWVQLNNTTARHGFVANVNSLLSLGFYFVFETAGGTVGTKTLRFSYGTGGGPTGTAVTPDNAIVDTGWHHIAVTGAGTGTNTSFYVDGVQKATTYVVAFTTLAAGNSSFPLQFGASVGPGAFILNGRMNNVMVHNRTLSSSEIMQLYTNSYQMYVGKK